MVTPRRLQLVVALAAMAGWTLAGCGGTGCLGNAVSGLHVTILDGPGGAPLCGGAGIRRSVTSHLIPRFATVPAGAVSDPYPVIRARAG
jgi:hypothetical protein